LVAVALLAQGVAASGRTLRDLADELPHYAIVKEKIARSDTPWESSAQSLRKSFPEHAVETTDGLRLSRDDEWLHVRPSGTEPVVRLIAESPSGERTHALIERARQALQ
jgi:phosphomannomutase